jgi:acyl-CoA dehydrogenase
MDHSFTDERKQIVEAAREFAINEFSKLARECDREEKFPMEIWKKASELGFLIPRLCLGMHELEAPPYMR